MKTELSIPPVVVPTKLTYPIGFERKSELIQVNTLAKKFSLDPTLALRYLKKIERMPSVLPLGCHPQDGNYAIISPFGFQEIIPGYTNPLDPELYAKSSQLIIDEIEHDRAVKNYFDYYKFTKKRLRQSLRTLGFYHTIISEQGESPIWILPTQLGYIHKGKSAKRTQETFMLNEFGHGVAATGSILIVHPERMTQTEELDIYCSGDNFAPVEGGSYSSVPNIHFRDERIKFDAYCVSSALASFGSASAFV